MRAAYPDLPDESDTEVREDGIAAHWLAPEIYAGRIPAVDSLSPNGRVMDEEMFDGVDLYLDVLRAWPVKPILELTLSINAILQGMQGTPDAWAYDPNTHTLYIADLKYGFRFVEVWFNLQLICYYAACLEALDARRPGMPRDDATLKVVFCIVQPRSYHRDGPVRVWKTTGAELRAHVNFLANRAQEASKPDALCTPNPGCVDCPGRHACQALHSSALHAVEVSYGSVPHELDNDQIGTELLLLTKAKKMLEARIDGLSVQAESALRNGARIPHFSLEPTFARERWRDGVESQVVGLGTIYNADLAKPLGAVSPAQARKRGVPQEVIAMFSHKPSTGVRLQKSDPLAAHKKFST